uniref:Engulfment and cell motility protein 1-like n=1 Tax=Phallusia mammillata TaxID=59560 RepID=A0A6F9DCE8_9ASCI|nr:engulfment and cell motility protein 1-like [Phallusia mammillata]
MMSSPQMSNRSSHTERVFRGIQIKDLEQGTISRVPHGRREVLKVAIEAPGATPQLYEINLKQSLQDNIRDFCERWNVQNPTFYALQHYDSKQYITERTRDEVKDGAVLKLAIAPWKEVERLLKQLKRPDTPEEKIMALKNLSVMSSDPTFANEFVTKEGIPWLIGAVEKGSCQGESLAYALTAFLEIMDHGILVWEDVLTSEFIKKIANLVNKTGNADATILQRSLGILECAVVNSQQMYQEISDAIIVSNLIAHLQRSNIEIQQNTIALINGLFMKAPSDKSKISGRRKISDTMAQRQFRTVILNHVIRTPKAIGAEMAHQLHVLQVLTFNMLEERMMKRLDSNIQEEREKLLELRNIAFDSSGHTSPLSKRPQLNAPFNDRDFKKLGFDEYNNPVLDFQQTPPGVLALDLMIYFARNQQDVFVRLVLENSSRDDKHECPFGKSSICITKMLCDVLKIGEQPTETGQDYYPMFFTHDHAFEEFFCTCILLLNKTWKEMSAIKDDFDKVLSVVRDQVVSALNSKPASLDSFKQKLQNLNYSEILKKRQQEQADKEQFDAQAQPVVDLQKEIQPEIVEIIKQQRLNYLKDGTVFHKISNKRLRDKSRWFCRLSPNHKFLHYGDVDDSMTSSPAIELLPEKLAIADVKDIVTGKHCPHIKNARAHKSTTDLAFSILYDPDEALNFIAPDQKNWCMWTDGINALLSKPMVSQRAKSDLDILLTMEMKLRLLDLENIPIPEHPPTMPSLPSNYNFALPAV